jgi:integrase
VPSEALALTWDRVDWSRGRIRVPSPKTEHHAGRGERVIPLFPELRRHLLKVFEVAEPGEPHVITRYRDGQNPNPHFRRIIRRAGLTPWPRAWHNLRASRQTELAATFPLHVVCAWLGNTQTVAMGHYLQVTESDYARALRSPSAWSKKTAQNPAHWAHKKRRSTQPHRTARKRNPIPKSRRDATLCALVRNGALGCEVRK